ncbi:MAG TPA: hypothetical protein VG870_15410 [Chitinophagaceae bacterium]|nr:hypothetical protein [Chitinophagaceae bacterium]
MLTEKEEEFLTYWEANRHRQKRFIRHLQVGLPMGVAIGIATFVNVFSGWDKRASMVVNADPSLILVLLIGVIGIVIFISIFTVRHRWDINEQYYRELQAKKEKSG